MCVCLSFSGSLTGKATIPNTQPINESMRASPEPLEKDEMAPDYRDAAFHCEDGGGADLEATIKAIQSQGEASAAAPILHHHETGDEFLSSFLFQMGMTETLDWFQMEWAELIQRGVVDTQQVEMVPDVYVEIQHLVRNFKKIQQEGKEYREASSAAVDILEKVRKARHIQQMHHQRVLMEKNRLIEELRKLKVKYNHYESELKRWNEKYHAVVKQTVLMRWKRDKAAELANQTGKLALESTYAKNKVKIL
uniref:Sperm associated antigen 16 n=1 Tax=Takifugu rubripes TaxID=31033 RepID=A0A3B5KE32_TAKRU